MNVKTVASAPGDRKYKKYYVLSPQHYERLQSTAIDLKTLSKDELEMVAILKNAKLSSGHRLKLYQQVLFKMLNKRANLSANVSLSRNINEDGRSPAVVADAAPNRHSAFAIQNDAGTFDNRARDHRDAASQTKFRVGDGRRLVEASTGHDETVPPQIMDTDSLDGEDSFSSATGADLNNDTLFQKTPRPRKHTQPFSVGGDEHVLESNGLAALTPKKFHDIFSNDAGLVDVERERENLVDEIRRLSSVADPRLANMQIQFLGDDKKDYIRVIDKVTHDDMLIEKSPGLMRLEKESNEARAEQQQQQQKQPRKRPATELEQLSFLRPIPPFKATRTRSGAQSGSGAFNCAPCRANNGNINSRDGWTCYEEKFSS